MEKKWALLGVVLSVSFLSCKTRKGTDAQIKETLPMPGVSNIELGVGYDSLHPSWTDAKDPCISFVPKPEDDTKGQAELKSYFVKSMEDLSRTFSSGVNFEAKAKTLPFLKDLTTHIGINTASNKSNMQSSYIITSNPRFLVTASGPLLKDKPPRDETKPETASWRDIKDWDGRAAAFLSICGDRYVSGKILNARFTAIITAINEKSSEELHAMFEAKASGGVIAADFDGDVKVNRDATSSSDKSQVLLTMFASGYKSDTDPFKLTGVAGCESVLNAGVKENELEAQDLETGAPAPKSVTARVALDMHVAHKCAWKMAENFKASVSEKSAIANEYLSESTADFVTQLFKDKISSEEEQKAKIPPAKWLSRIKNKLAFIEDYYIVESDLQLKKKMLELLPKDGEENQSALERQEKDDINGNLVLLNKAASCISQACLYNFDERTSLPRQRHEGLSCVEEEEKIKKKEIQALEECHPKSLFEGAIEFRARSISPAAMAAPGVQTASAQRIVRYGVRKYRNTGWLSNHSWKPTATETQGDAADLCSNGWKLPELDTIIKLRDSLVTMINAKTDNQCVWTDKPTEIFALTALNRDNQPTGQKYSILDAKSAHRVVDFDKKTGKYNGSPYPSCFVVCVKWDTR